MDGDKEVIECLNDLLTGELTAINVYYTHAKMCEHWGYVKLAKKVHSESIDEMQHADQLIGRVLYLDGLPNLQRLGKVLVGENVPEQFRISLDMEKTSIQKANDGIDLCRRVGDNGSLIVISEILEGSEEYAEWLETQLSVIEQVGEPLYLAQQVDVDD